MHGAPCGPRSSRRPRAVPPRRARRRCAAASRAAAPLRRARRAPGTTAWSRRGGAPQRRLASRTVSEVYENALAVARMLRERGDVSDVRHPGLEEHPAHALAARQMQHVGPLVCFTLDDAERAQRFLAALELVAEATSFGGVHSSAERRALGDGRGGGGLHPLLRRL